jgi:hypothetical protein
MIEATVQFQVLDLGPNQSASAWEKQMRFQREPYEKEVIELWPGGVRLPVASVWWGHDGSLVIDLAKILMGVTGGEAARMGGVRWTSAQLGGPPPETLQCWSWRRQEK